MNGEGVLEQVDEWVKWPRATERHRRSLQPCRTAHRSSAEFVEQAALADSRITADEHSLALSSLRVSQQIVEERDLTSPRDEGRRMLASVNESVDSPRVVSRRTAHGFEKKPPVENVSAGCRRDDRITRRRGQ